MLVRLRALATGVRRLFRPLLIAFGSLVVLGIALYAFGGPTRLLEFSAETQHKLTAQAMMGGTLRLYPGLLGSQHDEQVHNGATFTNFSFGVPLVQIPFHALARLTHKGRFFPDRLIFFIYLSAVVPFFWTSVHRFLSLRTTAFRDWFFSWSLTLSLIAHSLFILLSYRFIEYEEAIAYLVLFQFFAFACYLRFATSGREAWIYALGMAAGLATVIRPSGSIYVLLWGGLALWKRRSWRVAGAYAAAATPPLAFWLYCNYVKAGSPLSLGYQNTNIWYSWQYPSHRFGSQCAETMTGLLLCARALLKAFFLRIEEPPAELSACYFTCETRSPGDHEPFFPAAVALLILVSALVWGASRRQRLDLLFALAAFVAMFATFVSAGLGFSYRYVGDFWPLVALMAVLVARHAGLGQKPMASHVTSLAALFYCFVFVFQDVNPYLSTAATVDAAKLAAIETDWTKVRRTEQPPLPSRVACGDRLATWPVENGLGLGSRCEVATFTNLYLGVPERSSAKYELRFQADPPLAPELRVFVNGRVYEAHLAGGTYAAPVSIDYRRLYSPAVLVTVEWTRGPMPPRTKLVAIELV